MSLACLSAFLLYLHGCILRVCVIEVVFLWRGLDCKIAGYLTTSL